jgi:hypothetical protein
MANANRLVQSGMVPGVAKEVAAQIESSVVDTLSSDDITVPAFTGGGVEFEGGTLTEALQAIADATEEPA